MKIGFIGAGNMGGAVIRGFIKSNAVLPENINVIRNNKDELEKMQSELNINPFSDYKKLIENSDIVYLAVKPVVFKTLLPEISKYFTDKNTIVSMAAGTSIADIKAMLDREDIPVIRIMPNVNASIMLSSTAVCKDDIVNKEVYNYVKETLSKIGLATDVPEEQFAIFTAIAGCSPAYVFMFIDALAKGAVKAGMNKKKALEIASYAVYGSAALCSQSNEHPAQLCDNVCSPGGTTIEGVCTLDEYKFTAAVTAAVTSSIEKDKKM
jgi:pyrroline-5-carboxylate reductase